MKEHKTHRVMHRDYKYDNTLPTILLNYKLEGQTGTRRSVARPNRLERPNP